MLIDWFTVFAQAVNFLVLVWLLKRFLYKPTLKAIDERQNKIVAELDEAAKAKKQAEAERSSLAKKTAAIDKKKEELLSQATKEADEERAKLIEAARVESVTLHAQLQASLDSETANMRNEVSQRVRKEVFAIVRNVLADLADVQLESRMAAVLVKRLGNLEASETSKITAALAKSKDGVLVRSSLDLDGHVKTTLEDAIHKNLDREATMQFEVSPEIGGGIELSVGGYRFGWSEESYLSALEGRVNKAVAGDPTPRAHASLAHAKAKAKK